MRQKYGQNFLIDSNVANNIVKAANLKKQDEVLEIGPGKGILTKIIQPHVKHLTAVEIDKNLFQQLREYFLFNNIKNTEIINKNFLKHELPEKKFKVVSNLPYNIGTAIIQKILPLRNWTTAVFMLQKEVIERLVAKPGCKNYGYISIFVSYYADATVLFDVSPTCFRPTPKVVSSVIKLANKMSKKIDPIFFDFIKHAFSMRRKTILNSSSSFRYLEKSRATLIMDNLQLDPFLRPDNLSISDFLRLTKDIKKYTIPRV
jgi:16S rRNA (adenine1518-N6/adenine1519-N6)-dimethyltransferase